jgi:hypothetical protein
MPGCIMLRTVLTFLVGVPLLLPPGMCVCRFGSDSCCAAHPAGLEGHENASVPQRLQSSETSRKHVCCSHGARRSEASQSPSTQSSGAVHVAPCAHDHSVPPSRRHVPGCPALQTTDYSKWSEPVSVRLLPPEAISGFYRPVESNSGSFEHFPSFTPVEPGYPLYLALRTLLI